MKNALSSILIIIIISLFVLFVSCSKKKTAASPPDITLTEAEFIVLSEILEYETEGIVVYELREKLPAGSVIRNGLTPEPNEYTIENDSWFFFIDDNPDADWEHDCRYVFIRCSDGQHEVIDERRPPDNFDRLVEVDFN